MKISAKNKLLLLIYAVTISSVALIGWYGYSSAKSSYISASLNLNSMQIESLKNKIDGVIKTLSTDLIFNVNSYSLLNQTIWRSLKEKDKEEHWKHIYIQSVKDFLLNKKIYYKLRILDTDGNEQVSLLYDKKKNRVVEVQNLQNKASKIYFQEALKLKRGGFYISPFDLNMEHGEIERPFVPVIRYSAPIIDSNSEIQGIVVINFNAVNILQEITKVDNAKADKERNFSLLNRYGDYLYSTDKHKEWSFLLGGNTNYADEHSSAFRMFTDREKSVFIEDDKIYASQIVYPDKYSNPNRYWYLVTDIDSDVALKLLHQFNIIFFTILISILFISFMIINSYLKQLMRPLERATMQLKALSKGIILKDNIIYDAMDEIGEIVKSTNILVHAQEDTKNQANSVASGDFSQDIKLLSPNDELGIAITNMTNRLKDISTLASELSVGNYSNELIVNSNEDELGKALKGMVSYLSRITLVAESISDGNLDISYGSMGKDDRLGTAIIDMMDYLKNILTQAEYIANNDFSHEVEIKSKRDELGIALKSMTDILEKNSLKNANELFFNEGIGEFGDLLTGIDNSIDLSQLAIKTLCKHIDASSGVLYIYEKKRELLLHVASYAFTDRDNLSDSFSMGEGIVGQVAQDRRAILLKNIEDDSHHTHSATSTIKPKEVYAFALIHESELIGVIEIMSLNSFRDISKDYLLKCADIFASAYHSANQNIRIKVLLEKSQKAFEELQSQSEELQESNVQMEEQQQQLTLQSKELKENNTILANAKSEIDKRADDLEKASKYKNEFLANMSHELRTPLNSIILLSKLLSQNQLKSLSQADIDKASVINRAGNDLLFLINDILDLSKIESGNMELDNQNVFTSELISEIEGLFGALADEKGLEFNIDDTFSSSFVTDKSKLLQVLKNLLSNAFKFTKKGAVHIYIFEMEERLTITVKDSGIGIPENKRETVFEAFKQVDGSISREFGGTGLGLSITKTIVDLMRGDITVDSTLGEGTSFIVSIPLDTKLSKTPHVESIEDVVESQPTATTSQYLQENKNEDEDESLSFDEDVLEDKNILIVDDDSRNIFALTSLLESLNAEVFTAFNGQEAIEILEEDEEEIDLILMDIMMPVMDGIETIEYLKKSDDFKDIPIIAVTAKSMQENKNECLESGADDYLSKPIDNEALISVIKAWI